jgi:hypothetical protein
MGLTATGRVVLGAALLVFTGLLVVFVSPAGAASYCVTPATGCETEKGTIAEALTAAAGTGAADTIKLGATTYSEDGLEYSGASALTIEGAGSGATTIQRATPSDSVTVLKIANTVTGSVAISGLRIHEAGGNNIRALDIRGLGGGLISGIVVDTAAGSTNDTGVSLLGPGFTLRDTTVDVPNNGCVYTGATGSRLENDTLRNCTVAVAGQGGTLVAQRLTITDVGTGVGFGAGTKGRVEDSLLTGVANGVDVGTSGSGETHLTFRQSTVIGSGGGVGVECFDLVSGTTGLLTLEDSIVRGFTKSLVRNAGAGKPCSIAADYNDYDPATIEEAGDGSITSAHLVNVDPLFVDAGTGDYRLSASSPLLDLDPRPLEAGESATDLAGNPRISGGGRDLGAYELQVPAPPSEPPNEGPLVAKPFATASRLAPVKKGRALVRLRCHGLERCRGLVKLSARVKPKRGGRAKLRLVGKARFSVAAGKVKTVPVRLNALGRAALAKAGRRGLTAKLNGAGVTRRTVKLKLI